MIEHAKRQGEKLFLHCTVGEDRTGVIAGLWKYWTIEKSSREIMLKEMCAYGYEGRNPNKPRFNVENIQAWLTPFFLEMYDQLRISKQQGLSLDDIQCPDTEFEPNINHEYKCP